MPARSPQRPPVVLIIRDGWGENPDPSHDRFNAVRIASTPVDDSLRRERPWTLIRTCGEDVGLPAGVMGNSEVGHQNIGAGRIVDQELMRITRAIRDERFFDNDALRGAFDHARTHDSNLHIMGLVSDGKVHSDMEHLYALIDMASRERFPGDRIFIHVFTDGRDTPPRSGLGFVRELETKLESSGAGFIATVAGRYYAMDRDHRWERIARAYAALTGRGKGDAATVPGTAAEAIQAAYDDPKQRSDEFILPVKIRDRTRNSGVLPRISDEDAVIFFNFRGDRPRELTRAFMLDDAAWATVTGSGFDRGERLRDLCFCTLTAYEEGLPVTAVAFPKPPKMDDILGTVVSSAGLTQFRCAETEKFAHVTFFFNDYREAPFAGESRLLCPSPTDVATYDQRPQMSAEAVCDGVLTRLHSPDCESLIVVNFANPDMVGHTGSLDAAITAVETVDACVGRIIDAALKRNGSLIVTADHGNAEQMWDPLNDCPHTAHTTNDVPLYVVGNDFRNDIALRSGGRLADIAPTILWMMGLDIPAAMSGRVLVE